MSGISSHHTLLNMNPDNGRDNQTRLKVRSSHVTQQLGVSCQIVGWNLDGQRATQRWPLSQNVAFNRLSLKNSAIIFVLCLPFWTEALSSCFRHSTDARLRSLIHAAMLQWDPTGLPCAPGSNRRQPLWLQTVRKRIRRWRH